MSENGHMETAHNIAPDVAPNISPGKGLFRIGEVSRLTNTKPFVLRYWETEFPMLQPVKSPKGQRLYRREDVATVLHIKRLLYDEGFTIAGARRHLRDGGVGESAATQAGAENAEAFAARPDADATGLPAAAAPARQADVSASINRKVLLDLRDSLRAFLTLLESE